VDVGSASGGAHYCANSNWPVVAEVGVELKEETTDLEIGSSESLGLEHFLEP
jgi:hypothetical protein